jgi:hypothetical protein
LTFLKIKGQSLHDEVTWFHELGDVHEQNPFGQERPWDDLHWFEPAVHTLLYVRELSAAVDAKIRKII